MPKRKVLHASGKTEKSNLKLKKRNIYGEELCRIKVSSYVRRMLERFMEVGGYRCMDDVISELIYETVEDIPRREKEDCVHPFCAKKEAR